MLPFVPTNFENLFPTVSAGFGGLGLGEPPEMLFVSQFYKQEVMHRSMNVPSEQR